MNKFNTTLWLSRSYLFTKTAHSLVVGSIDPPETPGRRDEGWAPQPRQRRENSGPFELSGGSPGHTAAPPMDMRPRQPPRSVFGANMNNSSTALRNMIISPVKRPQPRNRPQMFT